MSDIPSRGCSIVVSNEVLKEKLHIGSKQSPHPSDQRNEYLGGLRVARFTQRQLGRGRNIIEQL
jgi:hypothetical protein